MKTVVVVATMLALAGLFVPAVNAGAGACVLGNGFTANDGSDDGAYVNVGQNSETGAFTSQEDYETECCAESGEDPDCFDPVSTGLLIVF